MSACLSVPLYSGRVWGTTYTAQRSLLNGDYPIQFPRQQNVKKMKIRTRFGNDDPPCRDNQHVVLGIVLQTTSHWWLPRIQQWRILPLPRPRPTPLLNRNMYIRIHLYNHSYAHLMRHRPKELQAINIRSYLDHHLPNFYAISSTQSLRDTQTVSDSHIRLILGVKPFGGETHDLVLKRGLWSWERFCITILPHVWWAWMRLRCFYRVLGALEGRKTGRWHRRRCIYEDMKVGWDTRVVNRATSWYSREAEGVWYDTAFVKLRRGVINIMPVRARNVLSAKDKVKVKLWTWRVRWSMQWGAQGLPWKNSKYNALSIPVSYCDDEMILRRDNQNDTLGHRFNITDTRAKRPCNPRCKIVKP